jgi:hypothetical protein
LLATRVHAEGQQRRQRKSGDAQYVLRNSGNPAVPKIVPEIVPAADGTMASTARGRTFSRLCRR